MFPNWGRLTSRPATPDDREALLALIYNEARVHTHLDWQPVEDWLGTPPFWLAERGRRMVGALACPPAPPDTAWVRLLAVASGVAEKKVWELLWPTVHAQLMELGVQTVALLGVEDWISPLAWATGFQQTHAVVVLSRPPGPPPAVSLPPDITLRIAQPDDADGIITADTAAFDSPWQLTPEMLGLAIAQADFLTVTVAEGEVVAYQLTTASYGGAHLARLAVRPGWQGRGLGRALTVHMLQHYHERGLRTISVNTQDSNTASLSVYQQLGFKLTGTRFPVLQLKLK